jgi:stage II sporulation SpoAA-like protein
MIELIEGLPENVVGLVAKGRLTKKDCAEILLPKLRQALDWHYKLRLYYEIRSRFPGAAWEAIDLGLDHMPWERIAIVTDVAALRHAVQALRLVIPGAVEVFETSRMAQGLAWITAPGVPPVPEAGTPGRRRRFDLALPGARADRLAFRPAPQYLSGRTDSR